MPKFAQHWNEEFAAWNGEQAALMWQKVNDWDQAEANRDELEARETDIQRGWKAIKLYEKDYGSDALKIWRGLAEMGSVWSMIEVARCYEYGRGVTCDPAEAEDWYKRAFAGGSQEAMLKCAKAAARRGDFTACEAILTVGVNQGWVPAMFWMAWYRHKQPENRKLNRSTQRLLENAARRGHPAALFFLANFMVRGEFGALRVPLGCLLVAKQLIQRLR